MSHLARGVVAAALLACAVPAQPAPPAAPERIGPPPRLTWVFPDLAEGVVSFSWHRSAAVRWVVQVASDPEFEQMVINDDTITKLWLDVKGMAEGRYYWRMAAVSEKGEQGPFTDAWTFAVATEEAWERSRANRRPHR